MGALSVLAPGGWRKAPSVAESPDLAAGVPWRSLPWFVDLDAIRCASMMLLPVRVAPSLVSVSLAGVICTLAESSLLVASTCDRSWSERLSAPAESTASPPDLLLLHSYPSASLSWSCPLLRRLGCASLPPPRFDRSPEFLLRIREWGGESPPLVYESHLSADSGSLELSFRSL